MWSAQNSFGLLPLVASMCTVRNHRLIPSHSPDTLDNKMAPRTPNVDCRRENLERYYWSESSDGEDVWTFQFLWLEKASQLYLLNELIICEFAESETKMFCLTLRLFVLPWLKSSTSLHSRKWGFKIFLQNHKRPGNASAYLLPWQYVLHCATMCSPSLHKPACTVRAHFTSCIMKIFVETRDVTKAQICYSLLYNFTREASRSWPRFWGMQHKISYKLFHNTRKGSGKVAVGVLSVKFVGSRPAICTEKWSRS